MASRIMGFRINIPIRLKRSIAGHLEKASCLKSNNGPITIAFSGGPWDH